MNFLHGRWREALLFSLIALYVLLSVVVYTDSSHRERPVRLSETEKQGLTLWRKHNCHTCHQLYGFGGFLGPDLTNLVTDETEASVYEDILTLGKKQMPAFGFTQAEQKSILAFLKALNRTGQSQPKGIALVESSERFSALLETFTKKHPEELMEDVVQGCRTFERVGCIACHRPFTEGVVGNKRTPDLSKEHAAQSLDQLRTITREGKGVMPQYQLTEAELVNLNRFFRYISAHRDELVLLNTRFSESDRFSWEKVQWFEYN